MESKSSKPEYISEAGIRSNSYLLKAILSNVPVVICQIDKHGNFTDIAGKLLNYTGLVESHLKGKNIFDVYPQISNSVRKVLEGQPVSFTSSIVYQGKVFHLDNYYFPEGDGSVGFIMDITEQKKAIEKIKYNENLLMHAQELSKMGIWDWDVKNNSMTWSEGLYSIFGYNPDEKEVDYQFYMSHVHPDDQNDIRSTITQVFRDSRRFSYEHRIIDKHGNIKYVQGEGKPVINDHGIVKIISFIQDVTSRKRIEQEIISTNDELLDAKEALKKHNLELEAKVKERTEELQQKNIELQKINADLDNFVYTASHDLKAPVSNIEALINMVNEMLKTGEDIRPIIDMVKSSIDRFKVSIADLSEITRIQKEAKGETDDIALDEFFEEIKLNLKEQIDTSGALIRTDFEQCERVGFSRKNLRSILYNLISNAIKYRHPDRVPEVKVETKSLGNEEVELSVSDNGLGFDASNKSKIFTMFKRLHDHVEGSGVGLYIVKKIIDNAGGDINVESEKGIGTTFKITIRKTPQVLEPSA
ncbi:ATP-binding protein [Cytophagaceae bacterium ABcell3]|nr:ATP-binding protein [Cytophagaceae bacterium ABcell3]